MSVRQSLRAEPVGIPLSFRSDRGSLRLVAATCTIGSLVSASDAAVVAAILGENQRGEKA